MIESVIRFLTQRDSSEIAGLTKTEISMICYDGVTGSSPAYIVMEYTPIFTRASHGPPVMLEVMDRIGDSLKEDFAKHQKTCVESVHVMILTPLWVAKMKFQEILNT